MKKFAIMLSLAGLSASLGMAETKPKVDIYCQDAKGNILVYFIKAQVTVADGVFTVINEKGIKYQVSGTCLVGPDLPVSVTPAPSATVSPTTATPSAPITPPVAPVKP